MAITKRIIAVLWVLTCLSGQALALEPGASLEALIEESVASPSAEVYARLGWAYLLDNQLASASSSFKQALTYYPYQVDAREGMALNALMLGRGGEAVELMLALVRDHPFDVRSQVYLCLAYSLLEETGGQGEFLAALEGILAESMDANLRQQMFIIQGLLYTQMGKKEEALSVSAQLNLVDDWQVVGPFANIRKAGHDTVYPPEEFPADLAAIYDGKEEEVGWRRIPFPLPFGVLPLDSLLYPQEECTAYALSAVYSPTDRAVALRLGASGALKVWLNGELVWENDLYRPYAIDQDVVAVGLSSGWNLLLVKVGNMTEGKWQVSARFTALDGGSLSDLSCSAEATDIAKAQRQMPYPVSEEELSSLNYGARQHYQMFTGEGEGDPTCYIYLAVLEEMFNGHDPNEDFAGQVSRYAQRLAPGWALPYYYQGLYDSDRDRGREAFEMALFLLPEMVPAGTELGIYYLSLGRQEKAWDIFRQIADEHPHALRARQYLAKISYENSWYVPMRHYIAEIEELSPDYYYVFLDKGLLAEHRGSLEDAELAYRQVLEYKFSSSARDNLVDILVSTGRLEEATDLIKEGIDIFPYNLDWRMDLVRFYEDAERHSESIAFADEVLSVSPNHWEALTWRGFAHQRLGQTELALTDFERAMELRHSYPWLLQYIEYITPQEEDYYSPYKRELDEVLMDAGELSSYVGEIAVYLLDQKVCRVLPNGTASYTVHKVIRLLSDEAVPRFSTMYIDYSPSTEEVKIRSARVILPTGEELNATQFEDLSVSSEEARLYYDILSKAVTMPGLREGAIIDFEYSVESKGKNIYSDYFGEQFYFGNYDPTGLSEYVLILPPQRRFHFHHLNGETPAEVLTTPQAVTYIFRREDIPGIVLEGSMPSFAELIPIVQVSTFSTWEEIGEWYWNLIEDQFVATDRIKQKVGELTAGIGTTMEKAKALYNFVVSDVRYVGLEFGIGGYLPHKAEECLAASYGDCKDKGTLLITMLREIGVEADVVLIRTRDLGEIDYQQPMLGLFNHFIILAHTPEGELFLDGTAEFHAYDQLPWGDQGVQVFIINSSGSYFATTPMKTAEDNYIYMNMVVNVAPDGSATATRHLSYGDYFAPGQRSRYLNPSRRQDQLAEYWNALYGGTMVSDLQFSNLGDLDEAVTFGYRLEIPRLIREEKETYYLPSRIPVDNLVASLASNSSRRFPLEMDAPYSIRSSIEYHLPEGAQLGENLPQNFSVENDFGSFRVDYEYSEGSVRVDMDVQIDVFWVEIGEYAYFRSFLAECDRREDAEIPYTLAK